MPESNRERRLSELEQLVCDFQAAALLGDDPAAVTPAHVELEITCLRQMLAERAGADPAVRDVLLYELGTTEPDLIRECVQDLRERLKAAGYHNCAKSMDLHRIGYNVVFWARPQADRPIVIEYVPRMTFRWSSILPRITVDTWQSQAALHRALGLGVVGPGEPWHKKRNATPGLFG